MALCPLPDGLCRPTKILVGISLTLVIGCRLFQSLAKCASCLRVCVSMSLIVSRIPSLLLSLSKTLCLSVNVWVSVSFLTGCRLFLCLSLSLFPVCLRICLLFLMGCIPFFYISLMSLCLYLCVCFCVCVRAYLPFLI